jgi:hypothetical protein
MPEDAEGPLVDRELIGAHSLGDVRLSRPLD